ncbi:MAG: phage replisome organizer N-terminal domain-containing protein [Ignavibacteriaceae bacterium]
MNLSFIKLDINILDDSKMKFIVKLPDGDKLFRLWIGLLCLGMKSARPGTIEIGDNIPFTSEMLAGHFDLELTTVQLALQTFQKLKMIEVWEDGTMFICNFMKHQQLDKIERAREVSCLSSKKYREKIKLLGDGHVMIGDETDLDKDKDKEQDKTVELFFEKFWKAYPKKEDKKKAYIKFQKINPSPELFEKILSGLEIQKKSLQWQKNNGDFIPLPTTWLNGERWNDEAKPLNNNNRDNQTINNGIIELRSA